MHTHVRSHIHIYIITVNVRTYTYNNITRKLCEQEGFSQTLRLNQLYTYVATFLLSNKTSVCRETVGQSSFTLQYAYTTHEVL